MKIFNFHIEPSVLKELKREYKQHGFVSVAEYIRHLIDKRPRKK